jgi:hypothetical protein
MSRLAFVNLALLLAVGGAGLWAYVGPAREAIPTHALSERAPAEASKILIERAGHPAIALERRNRQWRLAAPVAAEADAQAVERVLAILTARGFARYPAAGLDRYELERPRFQLTIDDERFAFGMTHPVSGEHYVLVRDAVYPIAPRYGAALPLDAMQMVRRRLLSAAEIPWRVETDEFGVSFQDGKWRLTPEAGAVSDEQLAHWVENWRLAAATRIVPLAALRPALGTVTVTLKDGGSIAFTVVQREPELVIARGDERLQYHFPAASAQRLLVAPARAEPPAPK